MSTTTTARTVLAAKMSAIRTEAFEALVERNVVIDSANACRDALIKSAENLYAAKSRDITRQVAMLHAEMDNTATTTKNEES